MFPLRAFSFHPRIGIAAAVSFAALTVSGIFLYQTHSQPAAAFALGDVTSGVSGTASVSAQGGASAAAGSAATVAPLPELHIANNGLALLRGARVVSISGETIQVEMNWNSVQFIWTVQTNSSTLYFAATGEKETSANVQVGDTVTITGMLVGNAAQPTINAEYIDRF